MLLSLSAVSVEWFLESGKVELLFQSLVNIPFLRKITYILVNSAKLYIRFLSYGLSNFAQGLVCGYIVEFL